MNPITQFEDLSDELFLIIFDYLYALDLFQAFSSLNTRISSILFDARLYVIISKLHRRQQIEFLSFHLTHHADQVIFISLEDQLRDYSSVIPFFFDQHAFRNLRSCIFYSICSLSKLEHVIQQLKELTTLESFKIEQTYDLPLSETDKKDLSQTMLYHKSSNFRSLQLSFRYNCRSRIFDDYTVNSTLTSLSMMFDISSFAYWYLDMISLFYRHRVLQNIVLYISDDDDPNSGITL
jgi:hypothetical protein